MINGPKDSKDKEMISVFGGRVAHRSMLLQKHWNKNGTPIYVRCISIQIYNTRKLLNNLFFSFLSKKYLIMYIL